MKEGEIPSVTPPIRAGFWCIDQAGFLAHVHHRRRLPMLKRTVARLTSAPIYSGGTALDLHQLPF